jgi:fused signal recognition particle receptor
MSLWDRLRQGLSRTRERLGAPLAKVLGRGIEPDPETIESLEEALLATDVGPETTARLIAGARRRLRGSPELDLRQALEREAAELLSKHRAAFEPAAQQPWVALVTGVNGVGKTTLAGKLAAAFARQGRGTMLVAADTFRAAATEQLDVWASRAGVAILKARDGADPAAVVHDGVTAARARGLDVVLVDTAGRLHTKQNLMTELEKVARVAGRVIEGAPHHTLLVLDATVGQNGVAQAREFQRAVPVTSLAINKLDGTARGGAVLAIADQLGLPISLVGVGEGLEDWAPFDPQAFAQGLFE